MYRVHVYLAWDQRRAEGCGPCAAGGPHLCCFTATKEMLEWRERMQEEGQHGYLVVLDEKGGRVQGPILALPPRRFAYT